MLNFTTPPGSRWIELGCGEKPHPACHVHVDVRGVPNIDFAVDMSKPFTDDQAISSDEFDGVYSCWAYEHVPWRQIPQLVAETFRILKPGGKLLLVLPNTEAQIRHILNKPEPDGDEGSMLFGGQLYPEDTHKSYWSPISTTKLLAQAGFTDVQTMPFGALHTDMVVQATKPDGKVQLVQTTSQAQPQVSFQNAPPPAVSDFKTNVLGSNVAPVAKETAPTSPPKPAIPREQLFTRKYFDGSKGGGYAARGFYWDYPQNWMLWKQVMIRKPESVLELGCGRGYVLKRLQDAGVEAHGLDISRHVFLTRACNGIVQTDLSDMSWVSQREGRSADGRVGSYDLCFSYCFLEHVPEDKLPHVFGEMQRLSTRGLHGITLEGEDDGTDPTRCTVKSREWWLARLPKGHEVFSKNELVQGNLPPEALHDSGLVKVNVGSYMTQFSQGWWNTDQHDLNGFAAQNGYRFVQNDLLKGLPWKTGEVDAIVCNHVLHCLTYPQALSFFKDCRRMIKPSTGVMRFVVPDAAKLLGAYAHTALRLIPEPEGGINIADFDEESGSCAEAATPAMKLTSLLWGDARSIYDEETLCKLLAEAKFKPMRAEFRKTNCGDMGNLILRETISMHPSLSLEVEAVPVP